MAVEDITTKRCSKCGTYKPTTEFHKRIASRKDGLCPLCKPCAIKKSKEYSADHKENKRNYDAEYREKNKGRLALIRRAYLVSHAQENRERVKEWALNNPDKVILQRKNAYARRGAALIKKLHEWKKNNPHLVRSNTAKRRAKKKLATPAWADKAAINEIYKHATEAGLHVDHIVPLRSRIVCGLHVEYNLQPIPPHENHIKSNRYWPDMP